jgi:hypothetical protein
MVDPSSVPDPEIAACFFCSELENLRLGRSRQVSEVSRDIENAAVIRTRRGRQYRFR